MISSSFSVRPGIVPVICTCAKGISLANIKKAKLKNINVTGFTGALLSMSNVTGKGLDGAVTIEGPKVPDAIAVPEKKYELR